MSITRFTTYREGGYQPERPDGNVEAQGWRCGCGASGSDTPPTVCPECGEPAVSEEEQ